MYNLSGQNSVHAINCWRRGAALYRANLIGSWTGCKFDLAGEIDVINFLRDNPVLSKTAFTAVPVLPARRFCKNRSVILLDDADHAAFSGSLSSGRRSAG
jgi:hypothetical protein